MQKEKIAFIYDFDGTLAPGNMQEHGFIDNAGMDKNDFWKKVTQRAKKNDSDNIMEYMQLMLEKAKTAEIKTSRQDFQSLGKKIKLFPGVTDWFKNINQYASKQKLEIEHFIVSSGLKEMIEGTPIAHEFKHIFASGFAYDQNDIANYPAVSVNYTTKTQYIFRINKGVLNNWEHDKINDFVPMETRNIKFQNMVYFGDGDTDVPCMKIVKSGGGHSIAVYTTNKKKAEKLQKDDRVNLTAEANYKKNKDLWNKITKIIDKISINRDIDSLK